MATSTPLGAHQHWEWDDDDHVIVTGDHVIVVSSVIGCAFGKRKKNEKCVGNRIGFNIASLNIGRQIVAMAGCPDDLGCGFQPQTYLY